MWTRCAAALVSNSPAADMSLKGLLRVANMRSPQSLLVFPARAWAEHGEFESRMMQLGCAASLRAQLAALAGEEWVGGWEVRMHLDTDPVQSLLHMVKGCGSNGRLPASCRLPPAARCPLPTICFHPEPEGHVGRSPIARPQASAHALIASDSSFSLLAAVLSRGMVLSRGGWKRFAEGASRGLLRHLRVSDDGSFDCAEATRLWDEAVAALSV